MCRRLTKLRRVASQQPHPPRRPVSAFPGLQPAHAQPALQERPAPAPGRWAAVVAGPSAPPASASVPTSPPKSRVLAAEAKLPAASPEGQSGGSSGGRERAERDDASGDGTGEGAGPLPRAWPPPPPPPVAVASASAARTGGSAQCLFIGGAVKKLDFVANQARTF